MLANNALALLSLLICTATFYLGCPNQQWFEKRPFKFVHGALLSIIPLVPAWFLLRQHLSTLSTSFLIALLLMLFLSTIPLLVRFDVPQKVGVTNRPKMLSKSTTGSVAPQWTKKTILSLLLGFPLALSMVGVFAWMSPGGITGDFKTQFVMWMVPILWLTAISFAYFTRTWQRLFWLLLVANISTFAILKIATTLN